MKRSLSEIDRVYRRMNQFASPGDKIKYCTILLQRTESFLHTSTGTHTEHMVLKSSEIIDAARKEIMDLNKNAN
jgi:hypothetical protein